LRDEFPSNHQYWDGADADEIAPRFYRKAREYMRSVITARVEMFLNIPASNDPTLAVRDLRIFADEATEYLWKGEHKFSSWSEHWNAHVYPEFIKKTGGYVEPLNFTDFYCSVWLEAIGSEIPRLKVLDDAIDRFWWRRLTTKTRDALRAQVPSTISRTPLETFPKRAEWLEQRLVERGWDHNDPPRFNGPDRKTVLKILAGGDVREDVLEKLAKALSTKFGKVDLLEIPRT
jgi:hypothetical protein